MGYSATIITQDFLTLSLEIDREISLEISDGWSSGSNKKKAFTSTQIILTVDELDQVVEKLSAVRESLRGCKICTQCQTINYKDFTECQTCEEPLGRTIKKVL